jgi:diguanylate cyclase (GGDEF)-like protein/PAS domain S-box-containing protein
MITVKLECDTCKGVIYIWVFSKKHIDSKAEPIFNEKGQVTGVFGTTQDVTEKKLLLENLEQSYKSLIEAERIAKLGSWEIDAANRKVVFCSDEVYRMYGIPKGQKDIDISILERYVHPEDRSILRDISNKPPAEQSAHFELRVVRPDGSVLYVDNLVIITLGEDGKPVYIHGTSQDITGKKELQKEAEKAQKRILHLSTHDQLTGLPNKISFDNRSDILTKSALGNNASFAIIMLDIDTLLYVKNILGCNAAEEYIAQIALKLKIYCGPEKFLCRFSANRFVIILEGTYPMEDYEKFIKGIYSMFSQPLKMDKYELDTEISIGVSFFSKDEPSTEQLVRRAETAIYLDKNEGKNKYRYYSPDLDIPIYKYFTLRNDLRKSIENNQLRFYYQPFINLGTNKILGAEVLLRWEHPEWGAVSPYEFITIAEETGYIITIGQWLIREVCSNYRQWLDRKLPPIKVAINFSSLQFFETSFVEKILDTIEEYGLDPGFLIMETTESVLMEKSDKVIADTKTEILRDTARPGRLWRRVLFIGQPEHFQHRYPEDRRIADKEHKHR